MDRFLPRIEDELRACLVAEPEEVEAFYGMLHYHMGWVDEVLHPILEPKSGKRLRPVFTLLTCQATGGDPSRALPAAAAVEIIHNFSLIHDDIEDQSDTRRSRRTVWAIWGEPQAINAGDALFTLAHLALLRLASQGVTASQMTEMFSVFDQTCLSLCRGQHLDMAFEGQMQVDVDAYMRMVYGKTAALLGCAGQLGVMVATPNFQLADAYRQIGEGLGVAFQIQDDLLGIWGDPAQTGKPVADDIRSRKKTLPVVYALADQKSSLAERLRFLYSQPAWSEAEVAEVVDILEKTGAREYAETVADQTTAETMSLLQAVEPEREAGEALQELASFFVQRSY